MEPEIVLVAALSAFAVAVLLWKLLKREKQKPWIEQAACTSCGWKGQVSRYAGRCPGCNAPLGEQRARRG